MSKCESVRDMSLKAMKNIRFIGILVVFAGSVISLSVKAQTEDMDSSLFIRAMKDELNRNMQQLVYEDYGKPFYIGYTIADAKTYYINASLGAIVSSEELPMRDWQVRVMVGSYQLNDENFQDLSTPSGNSMPYLSIPLDNDYYGIRRALWVATDQVYKSAGQNYKSKLNALKENNIDQKNLPIADFSRIPIIKRNYPSLPATFDKNKYEKMAREISAVFNEYPDIVTSEVLLVFFHADVYYINSEGIEIHRPLTMASLFTIAQAISDDGDMIPDQMIYYSLLPDGLPGLEKLKKDAHTLADNLVALKNAPLFNDSYTGPVLFMHQAVAELVAQNLFSGNQSLTASRESLYNVPQMRMYYGQDNFSLESKIGKRITDEKLSITSLPTLSQYEGIPLIGNFKVDAEGAVPPDTLELVKNGFLETLLNGRTPTRNIRESNGHDRYVLMGGGISNKVGPGVISITSSKTESMDMLKEQLIKSAKEEGLDYAIIIRPVSEGQYHEPLNVYKVNLENGEEQLVRSVNLERITLDKLRQIPGISNNRMVFNTLLSGGYSSSSTLLRSVGASSNGLPVTFILPDAMLLDNIELAGMHKPISGKLPVVSNPVGGK